MRVIPNNCVSEIKFPESIERADGFDYNPVLDVFVTFDYDYGMGASFWYPSTGKVLATFENLYNFDEVLFLRDNFLAVNWSEAHHGSFIKIYPLDSPCPDSVLYEIDSKDLPVQEPIPRALSPGGNLLVSEALDGGGIHEIFWRESKSREIIPSTKGNHRILNLCCSQNFDVAFGLGHYGVISLKVTGFSTEGKAQIQRQEKITHYILGGEKKEAGCTGIAHDGQNLIIAANNEIVLLESATEGSNALLIASGIQPIGQIRINHEGQLMVCEGNAIKLYEYKNEVKSLLSLCRHNIRETIRTNFVGKEYISVIPSSLENGDGNANDGDDDDEDDEDDDDSYDDADIRGPIPTYYADVVRNLAIPSSLKDYLLYKSV
ncbi:uncharacterized protein LOC111320582 [Stylophora pistillata]|nr:uncharacterized protein LOC111320582 [Stylophora pistillata]XP_022778978.1 uncharacterized protein LOC111320582 [Stylophora pistillata]